MPAEVKFTLPASQHQLLCALLKYEAKKIDEVQLKSVLATLGYKSIPLETQIPFLAEKLVTAIE